MTAALWGIGPAPAAAEDGRILERAPVELSAEELASARERQPEIDAILASVELSAITYESDGLAVKGFLAVPAREASFPA